MNSKKKLVVGALVLATVSIGLWWSFSDRRQASRPQEQASADSQNPSSRNAAEPLPARNPATLAKAPPKLQVQPTEPLVDLLKRIDPNGKWMIQKNQDGSISSIYGGVFPGAGKNQESALKLAKTIAEQIQVSPDDVIPAEHPSPRTSLSQAFTYVQKEGTYDVYDSQMSLFAARSDENVFMINTSFKKVGELSRAQAFSRAEAHDFVLNYFGKGKTRILSSPQEPVVFVEAPGKSVLAWVVHAQTDQPGMASGEFVVSAAERGRILASKSMTSH